MAITAMIGRAAIAAMLAAGLVAGAPAAAAGYHGGFGGYRGGYGGFHGGFGGYHGGYGGFRGGYGYRGYGGYYGGFGVGEALLGAAIIGGTAAIIASSDRPAYYDYPVQTYQAYPPVVVAPPVDYGYAPQYSQPAYRSIDPVEQCSQTAVSEAAARGDSGRVARIDHVDGYANGARVTGTLEVRRASRGGAVENARFTCSADYGQVTAFRFG